MMKPIPKFQFGLLGKSLKHSFSPAYFSQKWANLGINNCVYSLFELADIQQFTTVKTQLHGCNVTIPYKQAIIPLLDGLDSSAEAVGAVNTVVFEHGKSVGYNTDVVGFEKSLLNGLKNLPNSAKKALVLGTGGAAQAVIFVLRGLGIEFLQVSRQPKPFCVVYKDINADILAQYQLIINCSPLGMYPHVDTCPDLPYALLHSGHILYDLVYNPPLTKFLQHGKAQGCQLIGGLEMLHGQADAAWELWAKSQAIFT